MAQTYSAELVQQILVQAMARHQEEGFTRSQLEEMAAELGIAADTLSWAEGTYQQQSQTQSPPATRSPRRQQITTYLLVNAFLIALNLVLSGAITWAVYPLLGWGLGLLLPEQASPCLGHKPSHRKLSR